MLAFFQVQQMLDSPVLSKSGLFSNFTSLQKNKFLIYLYIAWYNFKESGTIYHLRNAVLELTFALPRLRWCYQFIRKRKNFLSLLFTKLQYLWTPVLGSIWLHYCWDGISVQYVDADSGYRLNKHGFLLLGKKAY